MIQFPDGLTVKNQSDPSVSCDMLVYFNWLKDRGLVEGSYSDWSGSSRMGFNNVFIYDLSIYGTKSSKKLEVETLFQNGKLSPEGFYCAVVLRLKFSILGPLKTLGRSRRSSREKKLCVTYFRTCRQSLHPDTCMWSSKFKSSRSRTTMYAVSNGCR